MAASTAPSYQGTAHGRMVELHGEVELPAGTEVDVFVRGSGSRRGSPRAVLLAVQSPPHVTEEDVVALEQAIAENNLTVSTGDVFSAVDES